MNEENSFGNMLKSLRVGKGTRRGTQWTQEQTAHRLGVSQRTYLKWENEQSLPSQNDLKNIVAAFGLDERDKAALYDAAAQVSPEVHNIPFAQNPFFTGRDRQIQQLAHLLNEHGSVTVSQPISISGLGGIGKTQLALQYAHDSYRKVYKAIIWVNGANRTTLQASYDALADLLELPEQSGRTPEQRVQVVNRWMETHTKWLLILDNADDVQLARSFLPVKPLGHVVITTRSQIVRHSNVAIQIEVDEMEPAEGLLFLLKRAGIVRNESELDTVPLDIYQTATELVTLLGAHPLALDQAGAYIEETKAPVAEYIELYQKERQSLLARRGSSENEHGNHPDSVAATIMLSFKKACERHPMATDLLHFCAFLQPDAIPEEVFRHDDALKLDTKSLSEVIAALRHYSLVKRDPQEKILWMHRL